MAILVHFFAGDSTKILRCLNSGGWPPRDLASKCKEEVGFKFGVMPEQALNALIDNATQLLTEKSFGFEGCVNGTISPDGESFQGVVEGKFVELFATFPSHLVSDLATRWSLDLSRLYESEPLGTKRRKRIWPDRIVASIQTVIFGAVVYPILGICLLIPSFRRERALNKKKLAEKKPFNPPTDSDLISSLIRLCVEARERKERVVYVWNI